MRSVMIDVDIADVEAVIPIATNSPQRFAPIGIQRP